MGAVESLAAARTLRAAFLRSSGRTPRIHKPVGLQRAACVPGSIRCRTDDGCDGAFLRQLRFVIACADSVFDFTCLGVVKEAAS